MERIVILLGLCALLCHASVCYSDEQPSHADHHHAHHDGGFEFGFSAEYTYIDEDEEEHEDEDEHSDHDDNESALGLHLHLIKRFSGEGFQEFFGIGVGGEILFTDDPHYGLMGSLAVYPWRELTLMVSPGVEIAKHDGSYDSEFAMHYEASYGVKVKGFHIGPVIGFSHTRDSEHYSAGIHIGF